MNKIYVEDKETRRQYFFSSIGEITPNITSTATEYPTSEGTPFADHVYRGLSTVDVTLSMDSLDSSATVFYVDSECGKVIVTYEEIRQLIKDWQTNATQLALQTNHDYFPSVVIVGNRWREGQDSWTKYNPTISFREMRVATLTTTNMSALSVALGVDYSRELSTGENNGTSGKSSAETTGGILADAAVGAGVGAAIGSIIPGVGTAVGAVVGGIGGAIVGFFRRIF